MAWTRIKIDMDAHLLSGLYRATIRGGEVFEHLSAPSTDAAETIARARAMSLLRQHAAIPALSVNIFVLCARCKGTARVAGSADPCRGCDGSGVKATVAKVIVRRADLATVPATL